MTRVVCIVSGAAPCATMGWAASESGALYCAIVGAASFLGGWKLAEP